MGVAAQWYYHKESVLGDSTEGPFSEWDIAGLIRTGKIKATTLLSSPHVTNGQWVPLSQLDFRSQLAEYEAHVEKERQASERLKAAQAAEKAAEKERAAQERARAEAESREWQQLQAREHQRAKAEYLQSVGARQKRYKVVSVEPSEAEHLCNRMGADGWQVEAAFAETFYYQTCAGCCQPEARREFVFVFSMPASA